MALKLQRTEAPSRVPNDREHVGRKLSGPRLAGHAHAFDGAGGMRRVLAVFLVPWRPPGQPWYAPDRLAFVLGNGRQDGDGQLVGVGLSTATNSMPESMRVVTKARFRED
jgi:hypothetical protein